MTLFLVIKHSNLETQLQYLPMIEQTAKEGNLRLRDFALFKDRIEIRQGREKIYGSQLEFNNLTGEYQVLPILNPEEVDERRKEMSLESMQEYLSFCGLN